MWASHTAMELLNPKPVIGSVEDLSVDVPDMNIAVRKGNAKTVLVS